ncbi:DUF3307 domain-containing protein [bacterium]|nr:DUF3307 domain-containing protein [bacterium]
MFIFLRLILAHLLADFPFQTSEIYRLKIRNFQGQVLHGMIVAVVSLFILLPFANNIWVWAICFFIGITHAITDWAKVLWTNKQKNGNYFTGFILDQIIHISVNFVVFITPLKTITSANTQSILFNTIYNNNNHIIYAISYVIVTFGLTYFIDTFKMTYFKDTYKSISTKEEIIGLFSRGIILTSIIVPGNFYLFIPLIIAAEMYLVNPMALKNRIADLLLGTAPTIFIGIILRRCLEEISTCGVCGIFNVL